MRPMAGGRVPAGVPRGSFRGSDAGPFASRILSAFPPRFHDRCGYSCLRRHCRESFGRGSDPPADGLARRGTAGPVPGCPGEGLFWCRGVGCRLRDGERRAPVRHPAGFRGVRCRFCRRQRADPVSGRQSRPGSEGRDDGSRPAGFRRHRPPQPTFPLSPLPRSNPSLASAPRQGCDGAQPCRRNFLKSSD